MHSLCIFRSSLNLFILKCLILDIKVAFTQMGMPNKMIIDKYAEDTDPITGFQNPFRRSKVDSDAIVIQRRNKQVTTYHLLDDANGHPIFTRPLKDRGKKFIFFSNPSFPQGSGHYIVLRKMEGQNKRTGFNPAPRELQIGNPVNSQPQFLYETFTLSFKDSLSGSIVDLDPFEYKIVRMRSGIQHKVRPNIRRILQGAGGSRTKSRRLMRRLARGKREIHEDGVDEETVFNFNALFINSTTSSDWQINGTCKNNWFYRYGTWTNRIMLGKYI